MEDMQRLQATQIRVEAQVLKSTLDTFFSKYFKKKNLKSTRSDLTVKYQKPLNRHVYVSTQSLLNSQVLKVT